MRRLSGHVEDADTKEKLAAATVRLVEIDTTVITDEKGDFVFNNLCQRDYTIIITHVDCEPVEQKISLAKDRHLDIFMPHARNTLSEVVVEGKTGLPNTGLKQELSGRKLDETKGFSISEALSRINGVTLLQTGSTISKPVIHGLHSNRILTINNGVRQEGQQWGNEHAPEIDPFIANKLTVIKGVDELRYGSDAIGGVILVEPKALRSKPGYSAEFNTIYFTNNRQYVVSGIFEEQPKKLSSLTYRLQGTFKKGANAATRGYRLNNTASDEKNFSVAASWRRPHWSTELFYSFFYTRLGIFSGSHIGNLADLQVRIDAERPDPVFTGQNTYKIGRPYQNVNHQLLKSKTIVQKGDHKFSLLAALQYNKRKEYDVVRTSSNTQPQLNLTVYTLSEELTWEPPKKGNFSNITGASFMQQYNTYSGRYLIPKYDAYTYGGYHIIRWSQKKWEAQAGVRYDYKTIYTDGLRVNQAIVDIHNFDFSTLASSLNVGYRVNEHWKMNTNISLASRAPNVNELLTDGIHHGLAVYEVGDINLKPEHAVNIAFHNNYSTPDGVFSFDLDLYRNYIRNFIYQQPMPEEPVLTIAGAFPKIRYKQTDALLYGIDFSSVIKPVKQLEWHPRFSLLWARNLAIHDWLILMPSNRVQNEITYYFKNAGRLNSTYFSVEMINVFKQTRTPSDKNGKQDYALPPSGYTLLNAELSTIMQIHKLPVTIGIGLRNLLDKAYREYMNTQRYFSDEMGRNIQFRIKIPIEHSY